VQDRLEAFKQQQVRYRRVDHEHVLKQGYRLIPQAIPGYGGSRWKRRNEIAFWIPQKKTFLASFRSPLTWNQNLKQNKRALLQHVVKMKMVLSSIISHLSFFRYFPAKLVSKFL
jgi:hypothetical protein